MSQQKLIPILDKELYPILFKGSRTKTFIIDFLNSYFGYYGDNRIDDLIILPLKQYIGKRLYISFIQNNIHYYYEIEFSNSNYEDISQDKPFTTFAKYYMNEMDIDEEYVIGKIILNFTNEIKEKPIFQYKSLKGLDGKLDIHVIFLKSLYHIIKNKSYDEFNLFERWISLLVCKDKLEAQKICVDIVILNEFLNLWSYSSKRIIYKRIAKSDNDTLNYLVNRKEVETRRAIAKELLKAGCKISFVSKVTSISIKEVIEIRKILKKKEGIKCE